MPSKLATPADDGIAILSAFHASKRIGHDMHESFSAADGKFTVSTLMGVSGTNQGVVQDERGVTFLAGNLRHHFSTAFPMSPLRGYRILILFLFTLSSVVVFYYSITSCWYITNCV